MADRDPLSDIEAYDRIHAASQALGTAPGATTRADTAMKAARRALHIVMFGLLKASDGETDRVEGVRED